MESDRSRPIEAKDKRGVLIGSMTYLKIFQILFGLVLGGFSLVSLRISDTERQTMQKCTMVAEQQFNLGVWNASYATGLEQEEAWSEAKDAWSRAIRHMGRVRPCSKNYNLAHRKISEYQASHDRIQVSVDP